MGLLLAYLDVHYAFLYFLAKIYVFLGQDLYISSTGNTNHLANAGRYGKANYVFETDVKKPPICFRLNEAKNPHFTPKMAKTGKKRVGERGAYAHINALCFNVLHTFRVGEGKNQLFANF